MLFTLIYVYATVMQWWRLHTLKNKLSGTLNHQNALIVCTGTTFQNSKQHRSLENLLFKFNNRIACTVVPRQKINLCQWIAFPRNLLYFPIFIKRSKVLVRKEDQVFLLIQSVLETYEKHHSEIIQVENFGELIGWKATDFFEIILKTNLTYLTKLVNQFSYNDIDINHELRLIRIETVDVEGALTTIKYEKKYLKEQILKYSYAPIQWSIFVNDLKDLYSKIREITNPKIKIDNGSPKCLDMSFSKLTKRDSKKNLEVKKEQKNLEVSGSEHRRHKPLKTEKKKTELEKKKVDVEKKKVEMEKKKDEVEKKKDTKLQVKKQKSGSKLVKQVSVKEEDFPNQNAEKPPNVLVYSESQVTKENVKKILYSILNKERYVIYDLPTTGKSWSKTAALVVVCGAVPPELTSILIQFFINGGQLLCLCSDLMYSVLHSYTTAEVREHELARFSYGAWEGVKMMHHVFCYQASPAKKQFSKDSDHSNHSSNGSSPLTPKTPSNVELRYNDKDYNIQVQVLGAEEIWHTPSLLLAKVQSSKGRSVFSQVHLEIDPEEYENDEDKYKSLLSSNQARLEILKDILGKHLHMDCDENFGTLDYKPGYFLGRYDAKMDLVSNCENISQNQLSCERINVVFCGHNIDPGIASNIRFPVLIHSCPSDFSTLDYFNTLETNDVGRLVIYSEILTSSQNVIEKKLRHGLVVIAKQQSNGVGRGNNTWLSPIGCAAFSLQLHIPMDTNMGRHLPLIQHLVIIAIARALKNLIGCDVLKIGIKWPNDLYVDSKIKIGGVVVNSTCFSNLAIVNIGCGVNLSNSKPTACINDLIQRYNDTADGGVLKLIAFEKYFAIVFNEIERLYSDVQKKGISGLLDLYYQYWLHSDAEITIQSENGDQRKARIVGIDQFGFLTVRFADGTMISVQPDGNSFDMMSGLIAPKKF